MSIARRLQRASGLDSEEIGHQFELVFQHGPPEMDVTAGITRRARSGVISGSMMTSATMERRV